MCGLVGLIPKKSYGFNKKQTDVFSCLLFADMLRGDDSTGVFVATNKGEVVLAKDATDSVTFLKTKEYGKLTSRAIRDGICMIGHNRKATTGKIIDVNAHPFVVDDKIVLVHNGTLWGDHKKLADVEVDSHAIAHVLSQNEKIEDALAEINGAYALIWYEVENRKLQFVRNSQRPLWWMETEDEWLWCSERNMLNWVAERFSLKVCLDKEKLRQLKEIPEHCLNTFEFKGNEWEVSSTTIKPKAHQYQQPWENYGSGQRHTYAQNDEDDHGVARSPLVVQHGAKSPWKGWCGEHTPLFDYESKLAKEHQKLMSYSEFFKIKDVYIKGKKALAVCFDYQYANDKDTESGLYMYLSPNDDDNIILRKWFSKEDKKFPEEKLMEMAAGNHLVEVSLGDEGEWHRVDKLVANQVPIGRGMFRVDDIFEVTPNAA